MDKNYGCNNSGEIALINKNSEYYTSTRKENICDSAIAVMESELESCKQRLETLPEIIKWFKILSLSLYGLGITGILIGPMVFGAMQVATQLMTTMLPLYFGAGVTFGVMTLMKYKSLKQEKTILNREIKLLEVKISKQKKELQAPYDEHKINYGKDINRKQILLDLKNLLLTVSIYENNKHIYQMYYKNNQLWERLSGKHDEHCIEAIENYITEDISKHKTRGEK